MKIIVTGGAGFIGSHLVDELISLGHEVVVVDNLFTGRGDRINRSAEFYEVDIRKRALEKVFERERPRIVFHLAAQTSVPGSLKDPLEDYSINVGGTLNITRCCRKFNIGKLIFTSTVGVYGEPRRLPIDERQPTSPLNPYSAHKLEAEEKVKDSGVGYTILRYANVYGPRQIYSQEAGVVTIFLNKMKRGKSVEIFGDGSQERDFVYVSEVVKATVAALERGSGEIVNIGTGSGTSINELFRILAFLTNYQKLPRYRKRRKGEVYRGFVETQKAKEKLDWQAGTTLDQGLKFMIS